MEIKLKNIIDKLNLKPHVEGGYYARTYQSNVEIKIDNKIRAINTAIYYLLEGQDFSCWHRLRSDEIWHYYCGDNLVLHQIDKNGVLTSTVMGNLLENSDLQPQCIIPANTWFAAEVTSSSGFTLVGCTVAPGFEYVDFEIGQKNELLKKYPQHKKMILKFIKE